MTTRRRTLQPIQEKLKKFEKSRSGESVLTHAILEKWSELESITEDAHGAAYEEIRERSPFSPVPAVLNHIFAPFMNSDSYPESLKKWKEIEDQLYNKGFRKGDLEFHDCGCEAVIFKIKGVDDVLLKISVAHRVKRSPFVLKPFARHVSQIDNAEQTPISLAVVPYLGLSNNSQQNENSRGMSANIIPENIKNLCHDLNVDGNEISTFLRHDGIGFIDPRIVNMRCHNGFANLPMVVDRRAVEDTNVIPLTDQKMLRKYERASEIYSAMQEHFHNYLQTKYGPPDKCFESLAKTASQHRAKALNPRS